MLTSIEIFQLLYFYQSFPCVLLANLRELHMLYFFSKKCPTEHYRYQPPGNSTAIGQDLKHSEKLSSIQAGQSFWRQINKLAEAILRYLETLSRCDKHPKLLYILKNLFRIFVFALQEQENGADPTLSYE